MKRFFLYLFCTFLLCNCGTEARVETTRLSGNVFGTTYGIIYTSKMNYKKSIDSLFNTFNNSLSTYIPDSIISRVNKNDTTVVVDDYFIEAFELANKLYKETDGYFDPTIGLLIDAYGFGSGKEKKELLAKEIADLMEFTGFDKITLRNKKIYKAQQMQFNVNAFAKGLGLDVVGRFLESKGEHDYLIEIGGEIRARGKKENGLLWKIGIDDPNYDKKRSISETITLDNESMATSGNYRKFKLNDKGEKIVHTVNPKTGLAQESNLLSVSVISKGDCANVDAYATAFLAMGLEKTKVFLKNRTDLKVILIYLDEYGDMKRTTI